MSIAGGTGRPCKVVVNPAARQGAVGRDLQRLRERLAAHGLDHSVELTRGPWHAAEIAAAAARDGFDTVAAAGGDGTCNEVLNGILEAGEPGSRIPALAVLPIGRGNDFAHGIGTTADLDRAVAALAAGFRRVIDVGRVIGGLFPAGRWFGNGVGIGFDTLVGLEAARMRRVRGAAAYAVAALKLLALRPRAPRVSVRADGVEFVRTAALVSLMNGRRMGGAFHMAPAAVADDGMLDLCLAEETGRLVMLSLLLRFMRGSQEASRHVTVARGQAIEVQALSGVLAAHADGETICTDGASLRVECVPARIEVVAPPPPVGAAAVSR
ncbi:MAG: YegS/Rv2252/BmrU family lipid kinase [Acidobacteriota bacterium]